MCGFSLEQSVMARLDLRITVQLSLIDAKGTILVDTEGVREKSVVGTCPECRTHVIAHEAAHVIYTDGPAAPDWRFSLLICETCNGPLVMYGEDGLSFADPIWLFPAVDDLNRRVPNALRIELAEAKRLSLAGFNLAAVLMCGRTLEGLAQLHGISERNLMRSLQRLQERGLIDDGMCKWASELRALRNVAAHFGNRDEIDRQDADDAIALTEAILDYVYVYATRFEEFKRRRRSSGPDKGQG
jgi:hypothetical protein